MPPSVTRSRSFTVTALQGLLTRIIGEGTQVSFPNGASDPGGGTDLKLDALSIPPVEDHVHHGLVAAKGHLVGFCDLGIVQTVCDQAFGLQQPLCHE